MKMSFTHWTPPSYKEVLCIYYTSVLSLTFPISLRVRGEGIFLSLLFWEKAVQQSPLYYFILLNVRFISLSLGLSLFTSFALAPACFISLYLVLSCAPLPLPLFPAFSRQPNSTLGIRISVSAFSLFWRLSSWGSWFSRITVRLST